MVSLILSIVSLVFSILAFIFSVYIFIKYVASASSTHTIQYVPLDQELSNVKKEEKNIAPDEHDDLEL